MALLCWKSAKLRTRRERLDRMTRVDASAPEIAGNSERLCDVVLSAFLH